MVKLQWQPSSSTGVIGYYVYRSTVSGGPYTKVVGSPVAGTSYPNSNVISGTEYYYVVTAVNADRNEEHLFRSSGSIRALGNPRQRRIDFAHALNPSVEPVPRRLKNRTRRQSFNLGSVPVPMV